MTDPIRAICRIEKLAARTNRLADELNMDGYEELGEAVSEAAESLVEIAREARLARGREREL